MAKYLGLTDEEAQELDMLDNPPDPRVKFLAPSVGALGWLLFSRKANSPKDRRDRVVELRTKMRMAELGQGPQKDFQEYYRIVGEEEKRFDQKFK